MESDFIKSVNIQPFSGTDERYHQSDFTGDKKEYISASGLKRLKVSPAHFREAEKVEETEALIFGSAYHCFMLQPEKFDQEYYVFNDTDIFQKLIGAGYKSPRLTKEYKEWESGTLSLVGEKKVISKDIYDNIQGMKERLMAHPYARMLLANGLNEQGYSGEIETEAGLINIKLKPDHINEVKKIIIDLKTTADASERGFTRSAADLDYQIQAAFYTDILTQMSEDKRPYTFFFIAQEKKKPYGFNIFECSNQFISQGRYEYEMLLQLYKRCIDNDFWPGYQVWCENRYGILELRMPAWSIQDLNFFDHSNKLVLKQLTQ